MFEQSQAVGGQWNVGAAHSGVWRGMRTNTSKTLTTFSDFPPPDDWAVFPRAEQVQAYHAAYAERFGEELAGQRVVVLGNSISGLELASDLAIDDSITVYSAFRKPRYVLPRVAAGIPTDWRFFTRVAAYLPLVLPPEAVAAGMKESVVAVAGHPSQYGAPSPHENIFVANISLCQHWLASVAEGRLQVRPNIVRVDGNVVSFADGSSAEVDTIICATCLANKLIA